MEFGLLLVFMYGILHAFGPDHLAAIADFSIGKQRKKVFWITFGFAIGHGVSLYLFALLLSQFSIPDDWLTVGDLVAALVIFGMGAYLIFLALTDRIHVTRHEHKGKPHVHIWYGRHQHHHQRNGFVAWLSASSVMGVLMGMGGARGMLISLSALSANDVSAWMIVSFTVGVALVFVLFGLVISWVNDALLLSKTLLRRAFLATGLVSCLVGVKFLFS